MPINSMRTALKASETVLRSVGGIASPLTARLQFESSCRGTLLETAELGRRGNMDEAPSTYRPTSPVFPRPVLDSVH